MLVSYVFTQFRNPLPDESRHYFRIGLRHRRRSRRHAESLLKAAGLEAWHAARATLQDLEGFAPDALLAVTSTTGMGELPDNLMPLYCSIRDTLPAAWRGLPGAVIALGDSSYGDTYCGGGEQMRELLPNWACAKCNRCCAWMPARR